MRTVGHVDRERPFEQLGPAQAGLRCSIWGVAVFIGGGRGLVGLAGNNLGPQGRVRREHAMEANEMEPGPWDESRQVLQEFQRAHHEMGGSIAIRRFELEDDLAGRGAAQPFVAQGRAGDVATEAFEGLPLVGSTTRVGNSYPCRDGTIGRKIEKK